VAAIVEEGSRRLEEMKMRLINGYEWREENEKKVMSV
jgi:hypothetical protein